MLNMGRKGFCGDLRHFFLLIAVAGFLVQNTLCAYSENAESDVDQTYFAMSIPYDDDSGASVVDAIEGSSPNVTLCPPDTVFMAEIFSADVEGELPEREDVQLVTDFQWNRFLNLSDPAPFFLCATNGHRGYSEMMNAFNETFVLPLFANATLTCQIVHSTARRVLNLTATLPQVTYGAPVPSVMKISKDILRRIIDGSFWKRSAPRLRLVVSPGLEHDESGLMKVLQRLVTSLQSGTFVEAVEEDFEWTAVETASNSTAAAAQQSRRRQKRERLRQRRLGTGLGGDENEDTSQPSAGDDSDKLLRRNSARQWSQHINPVLEGDLSCDFSNVGASIQYPYLRLSGFDNLALKADGKRRLEQAYDSNSTISDQSACLLALLAFVSSDPAVLYVEEYSSVVLYNAAAAHLTQSGDDGQYNQATSSFPLYDVGLDGTNQVVQVVDTGVDQNSCFFSDAKGPLPTTTISEAAFDSSRRKIVQYVQWADSTDVENGHGTHVAGTMAGVSLDTSMDMSSYEGVARGAKLAFFDMGFSSGGLTLPSNFATRLFPPGYAAGARIFSNSWGTPSAKFYTSADTEIDKFMYEYDDTLVLVSGGNKGREGIGGVASPALSKNVLSVGASLSNRYADLDPTHVAYFSSWGPTKDGRIKPDIVTPGRRLVSAASGATCGVTIKQGTSMACPVAAGSAAMVRQYFVEGWYPRGVKRAADGFVPTGALLKAMLINSAVPMAAFDFNNGTLLPLGLPPDVYQGHGRIKLADVLPIKSLGATTTPNLYVVNGASIKEEEKHVYKFSIPATGKSLVKITLVWIDPDTTASSATTVLHDLDLMVYSQKEGSSYFPNGRTNADNVNTVEKVALYSPTPGDTLTVTVTATSVATRPEQRYALAASGNFVSGAWYCQSPRSSRAGEVFTTENCDQSCDNNGFLKEPVCCDASAGSVCSAQEIAAAAAVGLECDAATRPIECPAPVPVVPPTKAPTRRPTRSPTEAPIRSPTKPVTGDWYCQFPRSTRSNDAQTIRNCLVSCDDSGFLKNPVCCPPLTVGSVCNDEEASAAQANGVACSTAARPEECAGAPAPNPPAPAPAAPSPVSGAWYCQYPRSTRSNGAYTLNNCNVECDGSNFNKNPICCLASAGGVCNNAEQAESNASGVSCSTAARPEECAGAPAPNPPAPAPAAPSPVSGAWYCQYPRSTRSNGAYTLNNCNVKCDGSNFKKNPICCLASAGGVCNDAEADESVRAGAVCAAAGKPSCTESLDAESPAITSPTPQIVITPHEVKFLAFII